MDELVRGRHVCCACGSDLLCYVASHWFLLDAACSSAPKTMSSTATVSPRPLWLRPMVWAPLALVTR